MPNGNQSPRTLQTVETACTIVDALIKLDGAGVTEVANTVGLSKSTAYPYLKTLEVAGFLVKDRAEYRLSSEFTILGEFVRETNPLYKAGRNVVDELAEEFGHYAHIVVKEQDRAYTIYEARGENATEYQYQSAKLQRRDPLHVTASGKAILAHLPADDRQRILENSELQSWTSNTISEQEALETELSQIREQGFAQNDEEEIEGFRAISAPVLTTKKVIRGTITISGPKFALSGEMFSEQGPEMVRNAANNVEVSLNMQTKSLEEME